MASGALSKRPDGCAARLAAQRSLLPHGGHQISLSLAAGFGLAAPHLIPACSRFVSCRRRPRIEKGAITLSTARIGFEGQSAFIIIAKSPGFKAIR